MPDRTDLVYAYDGSFEGLMCCVFESYALKEIPRAIRPPDVEDSLFDTAKWIKSDEHKTHSMALIYRSQKAELIFVDEFTLPALN